MEKVERVERMARAEGTERTEKVWAFIGALQSGRLECFQKNLFREKVQKVGPLAVARPSFRCSLPCMWAQLLCKNTEASHPQVGPPAL